MEAFSAQNFQHTPLKSIEQASQALDSERLDLLAQLGELTSILGLAMQPNKVENVPHFLRTLNPYEQQKTIEAGLKIISPAASAIVSKMHKLGNLPDYVRQYLDMDVVAAIARLKEGS